MVRGGSTTADPSLPPRLWRGGRTEQRLRRAEREVGGRFVHREIADTNGLFTEVDRKTSSGVMGLIIDALAREEVVSVKLWKSDRRLTRVVDLLFHHRG